VIQFAKAANLKCFWPSLFLCLPLFASQPQPPEAAPDRISPTTAARPAAGTARPVAATRAATAAPLPPMPATPPSAAIALGAAVDRLGRGFDGDVGIAIRDVQTGWTSHHRGFAFFPQQSVSKLWVAMTALDQVDARRLDLSRPITVTAKDLTLFHQPIRTLAIRPGGYRTTPDDLMVRALTQSDNSANDRLLREVGGPDAVREMLRAKVISGVRFGPGEKRLQASIAGLEWPGEWAGGGGFYTARDAIPAARRHAAFDAYVDDPVDGATPLGVVDALTRLHDGQLLSPDSTARLTSVMAQTRTGALRLKAGLRPGWTLSHKTGTGQVLGDEQAGYNDVGILTSPEGRSYAVAVLIGRTGRPIMERAALMRQVVAITADYDTALAKQRASAEE
jgi:beta-lactamase class A